MTAPERRGIGMALLVAAGRSRRMGTPKATLPWIEAGSTVISSAYDALAPFCRRLFVVISDENPGPVAHALGDRCVNFVRGKAEADMFASVWRGLETIIGICAFGTPIFIQPGDQPGVMTSTIERLIQEHLACPNQAIIPEYRGKGGHPVLVPEPIARMIAEFDEGYPGGLRQFWIDHPDLRSRIAVDDPDCVLDLDTPEEYESAISARQRPRMGF